MKKFKMFIATLFTMAGAGLAGYWAYAVRLMQAGEIDSIVTNIQLEVYGGGIFVLLVAATILRLHVFSEIEQEEGEQLVKFARLKDAYEVMEDAVEDDAELVEWVRTAIENGVARGYERQYGKDKEIKILTEDTFVNPGQADGGSS